MSGVNRTPFAMVPLWVYRHPTMTPVVMQVYLAIASRAYERKAPRGVQWIMAETELGKTSVYSAIATLRAFGAITEGDGGVALPLDEPPDSATAESAPPPDSATAEGVSAHTESDSVTAEPHCSSLEGSLEGSLEVTSPTGDATRPMSVEDTFELFWQRYPPRNGKRLEKAKALAQWKRLNIADQRVAYRACALYQQAVTSGTTIPKDAFRWLRDRSWEEWADTTPVRVDPADDPKVRATREMCARMERHEREVAESMAGPGGAVARAKVRETLRALRAEAPSVEAGSG